MVKNRAQLFQFGVLAVIPLIWVLLYTNLYYDSPYSATTSLTVIFRNLTNFLDPSIKYFADSITLFLTVLPFCFLARKQKGNTVRKSVIESAKYLIEGSRKLVRLRKITVRLVVAE